MNQVTVWTSQWTERFLPFLFRIRLRAAPQGCRNLLRTPARESGTGNEPRIRTVRQLAAAAGDGWLGSAGSPGQLETSLNSGYTVGPCNSYLEGPTPIFSKLGCSRIARLSPPSSSSLAEETAPPLAPPHHGGRAIADARGPRGARFPTARDFADARKLRPSRPPTRRAMPTLAAHLELGPPTAIYPTLAGSGVLVLRPGRGCHRMFGWSAGSIASREEAAESGGEALRQVPRIDPAMISGNPMARPTVMGSSRMRAPSRMATTGLM